MITSSSRSSHPLLNREGVQLKLDKSCAQVKGRPSGFNTCLGECTVNNMVPNIFLSDTVENDYNQGTRKFYCARGCNPLKAAGQTIVYPPSMLGNEANSPPIQISEEKVSVTCAPKVKNYVLFVTKE